MRHDTGGEPRIHGVTISEGRIRVRSLGSGEPVLYLHGVSARGDVWLAVARRVSDRARSWLPDLLSRGASTVRPDVSYDLDTEVIRAGHIADALAHGPERDTVGDARRAAASGPRIIVGHSQGAAIALALAAVRPGVEGLLLSNPVTPWIRRPHTLTALRVPWVRRSAARLLAPLNLPFGRLVLARAGGPGYRASDEQVERYSAPYGDAARAEALMRVLSDWRPSELAARLPRRPLEVRVVAGTHDPRIPVASARRLAGLLDASFTVLPRGGHILPEQRPDALARELRALMDGLRPPGAQRSG